MIDRLLEAVTSIVPPVDDNPLRQRKWRLSIALWQIGLTAFVTFHVAWACNWLPGIGGFAMAADVEKLQRDVHTIIVAQVRGDLFAVRVKQCEAMKEGRPTAVYAEKLQDLLAIYEDATGGTYRLPLCQEM
jgi:hypothetical protein